MEVSECCRGYAIRKLNGQEQEKNTEIQATVGPGMAGIPCELGRCDDDCFCEMTETLAAIAIHSFIRFYKVADTDYQSAHVANMRSPDSQYVSLLLILLGDTHSGNSYSSFKSSA